MKVFELFSGIGGMHFALKESGIQAEVVKAVDINTTANEVYRQNFPSHNLVEKNIQGLTEDDFNNLNVEMILMSPPCQPHTRNGLKKDKSDQRSDALLHILTLIPKLKTVKYILLENVKGFETSTIRDELIKILNEIDYSYQEFLLSPTQFALPNSRLRYYLLAKKKQLDFCFSEENSLKESLPILKSDVEIKISEMNRKYEQLVEKGNTCFKLKSILEEKVVGYSVPEKLLQKYGTLFDIVTKESSKSCCFTKGYTHFVEGTGSVLSLKSVGEVKNVFDEIDKCEKDSDKFLDLLKSLQLRYFTPVEISKLMCFPETLAFPDHLTDKQKYRLLGNSINVHVVALLIIILVS